MSLLINSYRFAVTSAFDPIGAVTWQSVFWAEDPAWTNPGNGNPVTSWNNAGTDATDATEATNPPVYASSVAALNSKPAIDFDGTNDLLVANVADLTSPWTLVVICTHDDTATDSAVGFLAGTNGALAYVSGTGWRIGSATANVVGTTGDTVLLVGLSNGASSTLEVNGVGPGTVNGGGVGNLTELRIGNRASALPFDGKIAFVGLKSSALTAPELAYLEAGATSHYGIAIS